MPNRFTLSSKKKIVLLILIPFLLGLFLWFSSDSPPYGYPGNELSNNYWGTIVNIAHKWRTMEFSFWDKGLQGGWSFFASGQYPIFNPTNGLCFFFNDNDFYLIKLIEPYFLGILFMLILLNRQYKLNLPISIFGSFLYMGAIFTRHSIMLESPFFLWGISLFPLMVIVMERYIKKNIYLSATLVGVIIAWMFAGEGVIQVPQLLIWWSMFYLIYICQGMTVKLWMENTKKWLFCVALLGIISIGLFGFQIIPTYEFVSNEIASRVGHYELNNFPLWGYPPISLAYIVIQSFKGPGGVSGFCFGVLLLGTALLTILNPKKTKIILDDFYNLRTIWLTTILFLLTPSVTDTITTWLPFTEKYLSILSSITFKYGLHILDFCFAVTFCMFLDNEKVTLREIKKSKIVIFLSAACILAAILYAFIPVTQQFSQWGVPSSSNLTSLLFSIPKRLVAAVIVFLASIISLFYLLFRPKNILLRSISLSSLILLGFMTVMTSYSWNDKGRQTSQFELFCWDCPEHQYYKEAKNKYFLFMPHDAPYYMGANYSLIYDVYSTAAFMPLDPKRYEYFQNVFDFDINAETAPNYFPINFTAIPKEKSLRWKDFHLKVKGKDYDIYERQGELTKVFFTNSLTVAPLDELIPKAFHGHPAETFYIAEDDEKYLKDRRLNYVHSDRVEASYQNYTELKQGSITFNAVIPHKTFALIPEMFQKGWQVKVDGKSTEVFPVNYLFIGFRLPAGEHSIKITYVPPGIFLGTLISILSILLLAFILYRHKKTCA